MIGYHLDREDKQRAIPGGTTMIGLAHYLTVAAILFVTGIFGIFLNRKNVIIILMSIELMLLAVNINFVAFSAYPRRPGRAGLHHVRADRRRRRGGDRAGDPGLLLPQPRHDRRRRHQRDEGLSRDASRSSFSRPCSAPIIAASAGVIIGEAAAQWHRRPALLFLACVLSLDRVPDLRRGDAAHPYSRLDQSGTLDTEWAIRLDRLTAIMLVVVTTVSALGAPLFLGLHGA